MMDKIEKKMRYLERSRAFPPAGAAESLMVKSVTVSDLYPLVSPIRVGGQVASVIPSGPCLSGARSPLGTALRRPPGGSPRSDPAL